MSMDEAFEQHEEIPAGVSRRIRAAHRAEAPMPDPAPAAELWAAGRRRRQMRRMEAMAAVGGPLAAAAAVAMVVWAGPWQASPTRSRAPSAALSAADPATRPAGDPAGDMDGSGRIDMLDALRLALAVERGGPGRRDVNGDGRVDERDVEALAALAVSLDQESTL